MVKKSLVVGKTYFAIVKEGVSSTGFYDDVCQDFYLCRLLHCLNVYQVKLHAYLLQPRQIFFLFTPLTPNGFYSLVGFLNRSYSDYFSSRFCRTIRVWRDNPSLNVVSSSELVLDCQKFIERYPLTICSLRHPGEYKFSSYCSNAFTRNPQYLSQHPSFRDYLSKSKEPLKRYRAFIDQPFSPAYLRYLESRLMFGRPLLSAKAQARLEKSNVLTDKDKNGRMTLMKGSVEEAPCHAFR
jgi:putative transposase